MASAAICTAPILSLSLADSHCANDSSAIVHVEQVPADAAIAVPSAREVQDYGDNQRAMSDRQAGSSQSQQGHVAVLHQISPYVRFQVS